LRNGQDDGLKSADQDERREIHGRNEILSEKKAEWKKIAGRFLGLVPVIMLITAVISASVTMKVRERYSGTIGQPSALR
jgi:magnesium-transporting ATPase (P-type)